VALLRRKTGILETNGLPSEEDPVLAEFFFEDLILGTEALDDFSLTAVAPTSEDGEQRLPGLEDEVHSGPDAAVTTSKASGLEEDLSIVSSPHDPVRTFHRLHNRDALPSFDAAEIGGDGA
jgi:hypothetical protein